MKDFQSCLCSERFLEGKKPATKISRLLLILAMAFSGLACTHADENANFLVACMRVLPQRWNKAHNLALLERHATQAAGQGAELVVTCEGFLDGYCSNANHVPGLTRQQLLDVGEPVTDPFMQRIGNLATKLKIHLAVGFLERRGDKIYNSMVVYSPTGDIVLHYSKTHTKGETFNTPGTELPVAQTSLGTFGALICYDRRFPEVPRILALKGAQILLIPAYGNDGERNEALLRTRAWENSVWVIYVRQNQALVIKPNGKIIARDHGTGDELVFARIELDKNVGTGDILQRRSPEFYHEIIEPRK